MTQRLYLISFLFLISVYSHQSFASASGASVVSVPSGKPVYTLDKVIANTVAKGPYASDPYRVATQSISKAKYLLSMRKLLAFGLNPWSIAALAALDYFIDVNEDTGQPDLFKAAGNETYVDCNTGPGKYERLSLGACSPLALAEYQRSSGDTSAKWYGDWVYSSDDARVHRNLTTIWGQRQVDLAVVQIQNKKVLVSDNDLWADTKEYVLNNDLNHNGMFADEAGNVDESWFDDGVKYNPDANENDLELMDLYRAGLLQSEDPSAPYYVAPEKLEEIKDLVNKQDAAKTPEGQADKSNQELKDPLTQAEFEESMKKMGEEANGAGGDINLDSMDKTGPLDETFTLLNDGISNITDLPGLPSFPTLNHSSCRTITIGNGDQSIEFPSSSQCSKLEEAKTVIGYFLYFATALGIIFALIRDPHK